MFIERAADNGSPGLQGYGSNLAFIQNANTNSISFNEKLGGKHGTRQTLAPGAGER